MRKPKNIPVHKDELKSVPVEIHSICNKNFVQDAHRDDHYMFIIQQEGLLVLEVDFKEMVLSGPSLCFVAPGQVHRYINVGQAKGWLFFVGADMITKAHRDIFDVYLNLEQTAVANKADPVFRVIPILEEIKSSSRPLQTGLVRSFTETVTGLVVSNILLSKGIAGFSGSQKYSLTSRYKQLVAGSFKEIKQVKEYSALLHITPLYLNEVIKETTGFPASHWIIEEILLEAKRLLYYTALDVKQIAYDLGYNDHAYFSRFFRKNAGDTPLAFRNSKPLFVQS